MRSSSEIQKAVREICEIVFDERCLASAGYSFEDAVKVTALLVSDAASLPGYSYKPLRPMNNLLEAVVERNLPLLTAFEGFWEKVQWDKYTLQAKSIYQCLTGIPREDIFHIPGMVHELLLARQRTVTDGFSKRKTQGSYYTPLHIVRQMIEDSLQTLAENDNFTDLKILDPACGGASFILEAWRALVSRGFTPDCAVKAVHGIDIDRRVIELSRFVLTSLLWTASDRNSDPLVIRNLWASQLRVGNALTSLPGYDLCDPNIFLENQIDWAVQFPEVFTGQNRGGFDLVIGNPPYVANKLIPPEEKQYYQQVYQSAKGQFDLSVPFIEQGMHLLKPGGLLCYITSNKFLASDYGRELRRYLLKNCCISTITDVSMLNAFAKTAAYPVIFTVRKTSPPTGHRVEIALVKDWSELARPNTVRVEQNFFNSNSDYLITTYLNNTIFPLIKKLNRLGALIPQRTINCGLALTGFGKLITGEPDEEGERQFHPIIQAGQIGEYVVKSRNYIDIKSLQRINLNHFKGPKIIVPGIATRLRAAVDYTDSILGRVYYIRQSDTQYELCYLAALFNSMVLNFYYKVMYWPVHLAGGYLRFNSGYLGHMPIIDPEACTEPKTSMAAAEITEIGRQLVGETLSDENRDRLTSKVEALVFRLYGMNSVEAGKIMTFLGLDTVEREKITMLMKEE